MLKKIFIFIMLLALSISSSACIIKSKADIEFRETVSVLGIDEEDDLVKLTAVLVLITPTEGNTSGSSKTSTYTAYGKTMFDAIRNFHSYTDKDIMWGHLDFVLVGEETAKNGISKYIDIISRDHEIKQNARLMITKETTANEFITTTSSKDVAINDILLSLSSDIDALSESSDVTILDYMQMMGSPQSALFIPYIRLGDYKERSEEEKDIKDIVLSGYAVFDEDELAVYLDSEMSRGINWVIGEIKSCIIVVNDKEDNPISMEVISSKPKINAYMDGGKPSVKIEVEFTTNIGEYTGDDNIFTDEMINYIIRKQNDVVKKEISDTIQYLRPKGLDTMGLCCTIYRTYPKETDNYKESWPEVFKEMDVYLKINSLVNRTYNMNQPVTYKDEKDDKK